MLGYDWPRLHAALNDLPAALLLAAVLFELAGTVTRRATLRTAGFWTLMLGVVGGALAVVSGLQAEDHIAHGEAVHQVMETHEELALITVGIFAVLALWRIVREKRMGGTERALTLALSLGGVGMLVATGTYGGRLVFEHAAGIPTDVLQAEMHERSEDHHHHGGEAAEAGENDHAEASPAVTADSAAGPSTPQPTARAGHTHAPGTPPHKD
ncbi:MAG: DUF2231 domain-containing protein [Gemmatimonadales bacterium]